MHATNEVRRFSNQESSRNASKQSITVQRQVIMQRHSEQRCRLSQAAASAAPSVCAPAADLQHSTPPATRAAGRFPPPAAAALPGPIPHIPAATGATDPSSSSNSHTASRDDWRLWTCAPSCGEGLYALACAFGWKRRQRRPRRNRNPLGVSLPIYKAGNQPLQRVLAA